MKAKQRIRKLDSAIKILESTVFGITLDAMSDGGESAGLVLKLIANMKAQMALLDLIGNKKSSTGRIGRDRRTHTYSEDGGWRWQSPGEEEIHV